MSRLRLDTDARLVALDWGWVHGLSKAKEILPDSFAYVANEYFFWEAIRKRDENTALVAKASRVLKLNAGKVFVGRFPHELIRLETKPGSTVERESLIDLDRSRTLAEYCAQSTPEQLTERGLELGDPTDHENAKNMFALACSGIADAILDDTQQAKAKLFHNRNEHIGFLRLPEAVAQFTQTQVATALSGESWSRALQVFPDVHAAGRWARIILWYVLASVRGDHAERNDFEDAHCAFVASYCDFIASGDKRTLDLVNHLFPNTQTFAA